MKPGPFPTADETRGSAHGPQKRIRPLRRYDPSDLSVGHLAAEMEFVRNISGANDNSQQRVFVGNIQIVEDSQRMIRHGLAKARVIVRLDPLDDCLGASGDAV